MDAPIRLTWLAYPLLDWHPFSRNIFAPLFWTVILFSITAVPLLLCGQLYLAFTRPFYVCFIGIFCELLLAYGVMILYPHIFRDLPLAILPSDTERTTKITSNALAGLNSHRQLLLYTFLPLLVLVGVLASLSLYQVLEKDDYPFFHFLQPVWYAPNSSKVYRLFSLWFLMAFTGAILYTGFWFLFYHWYMFHQLLTLKAATSPILVYNGFSKAML